MARIPKKYINTSFFHIMVQGISKECIFNYKKDVEKYLSILKKTKEEVKLGIISYCIMNNHAHLLIYTEDTNELIKYMHKSNLKYAKYYNNKYSRVGYVFRDRYKTQPIFSEKHLYTCIDYIHNNPVKAKICNNASEYIYSSYNNNIFNEQVNIPKNISTYIKLRKQYDKTDEEFTFMEYEKEKDNIYINVIKDFLLKNNTNINEIKKDKILLSKLVKKLKEECKVSYRMMEKEIGISRETLRKLT